MIISDSKYLWAYLNSKIFKWYKKVRFVAYGDADNGGRIKLDYNKMINVPIKQIDSETEEKFNRFYYEIISQVKKTPDSDTSKLEKEIDQLIYKLYGLTEEEIKIVEESVN